MSYNNLDQFIHTLCSKVAFAAFEWAISDDGDELKHFIDGAQAAAELITAGMFMYAEVAINSTFAAHYATLGQPSEGVTEFIEAIVDKADQLMSSDKSEEDVAEPAFEGHPSFIPDEIYGDVDPEEVEYLKACFTL